MKQGIQSASELAVGRLTIDRRFSSTRQIFPTLLILAALATGGPPTLAGASTGEFLIEPIRESFTQEHIARARLAGEAAAGLDPALWEDQDAMEQTAAEAEASWAAKSGQAANRGGTYLDDSSTHYARGTTLIIHVFINHAGGTWEYSERQDAGAKASLAKDYFLDNAPSNAWLHFDNEGTNNYLYYIVDVPYDLSEEETLPGYVINESIQQLGFGDGDGDGQYTDDFTLYHQGWNGGWNNVIACFEPDDMTGQAWASYERAYVRLYTNSYWQVWAHEWGHTFGACDEYGDGCSSCVDICQSWYLNDDVPNGNCEDCAGLPTCLMKYAHEALCEWTPRNWAWRDLDGNGQLDRTVRYDSDFVAHDIWELYHNGWLISTNTDWSMVAPQRWNSWSATGVRNRDTSNYDIYTYADNNRFHPLASSTFPSTVVDFVVGDFNHNKKMETHIELRKESGAGQYVLSYESGNGILYPDGQQRSYDWDALDVVRTYDVPLFKNETILFYLDPSSGIDLGMALFASDGDEYFAGRSENQVGSDLWVNGANESFEFTAPDDDVYGLVVWGNNEADGTFSIRIGPGPILLPEEVPVTSNSDLSLYAMNPANPYWAVVAARPTGTANVSLRLCEDIEYQDVLATSGAYPNVEFIAADYHPSSSLDWIRTWVNSGAGSHNTEWEQSADLLTGSAAGVFGSSNVAKVWDVWLESGMSYMLRQYNNGSNIDCGIYAISSADGDRYTQRSGADGGSNSRPPEEGGEWFLYSPPADDYYGFVTIKNDDSNGHYSVAYGPRFVVGLPPWTFTEELLWSSFNVAPSTWNIIAARADPTSSVSAGLWDCDSYGGECFVNYAFPNQGVQFMAVDGWGGRDGHKYARFQDTSPTETDVSADNTVRLLTFDEQGEVLEGTASFIENGVAHIWDLFTTSDLSYPLDLTVSVIPSNENMDLAVYVLDADLSYHQEAQDAIGFADDLGPGGMETASVTFPAREVHAVVVFNVNGAAGSYEIYVSDMPVADVELEAAIDAVGLELRSAHPMREEAVFDLALPTETETQMAVFDLGGRLVRSLVQRSLPAGAHTVRWDGTDGFGREMSSGVYLVKLRAGPVTRTAKILLTK